MTHDNENPVPAETTAQDVSLALLTLANPAFRFSFMSAGFHRAKWLGRRRKPVAADEGKPEEVLDPAALPPDRDDPGSGSD